MREHADRELALECLKLAVASSDLYPEGESIVGAAGKYFAFVTGDDQQAAHAKLEAVKKAIG